MVSTSVSVRPLTSVTVRFTGYEPTAVGTPEISPVSPLMVMPAGSPVADQPVLTKIAPVPGVAVFGTLP